MRLEKRVGKKTRKKKKSQVSLKYRLAIRKTRGGAVQRNKKKKIVNNPLLLATSVDGLDSKKNRNEGFVLYF
jgi:hypothetical protein